MSMRNSSNKIEKPLRAVSSLSF